MAEPEAIRELGEVRRQLELALRSQDEDLRKRATHDAMAALARAGFAAHRHPEQRDDPAFGRLIEACAALLPRLTGDIGLFLHATARPFRSGWDETDWERACNRRSSLAFLEELFAATPAREYLDGLDTGWIDDLLRDKGITEGSLPPEEIPSGAPPTHWWWWYPDPPPA